MTKKAIKEKYSAMVTDIEKSIQYYREELEKYINAYCTLEEITGKEFRALLRLTIDRLTTEDKQDFIRSYVRYGKVTRELTIITEILADIQ